MQEETLASLANAHLHFVRWERVRHRACTVTKIAYPEGHPLRLAVDAAIDHLELVRSEAQRCLFNLVKESGRFRGLVNGYFFDHASEESMQKGNRNLSSCAVKRSPGRKENIDGHSGPCHLSGVMCSS